MKITAIALPLLIAATFSMPAQARDPHVPRSQTSFQLTITSGTHGNRNFVGHNVERRKDTHKRNRFNRLRPKQIARILHNRGFSNLRKMRTDGRVYTLKANGRRGNVVRLTVSARTGEVLRRNVIRRAHRDNRWNNNHRNNGWTQSRNWSQNHNRQPFWMY